MVGKPYLDRKLDCKWRRMTSLSHLCYDDRCVQSHVTFAAPFTEVTQVSYALDEDSYEGPHLLPEVLRHLAAKWWRLPDWAYS